jgi:hypothetical protein
MEEVGLHDNISLMFLICFVPFPMVRVFRVAIDKGFSCARPL